EHADHAVIALVTASFIHLVLLIAVLRQFLHGSPRFRKRRRILYGYPEGERIGVDAFIALDQMQVLTRPMEICLLSEIGDVNDQRVTFPMGAGISESLAHLFG